MAEIHTHVCTACWAVIECPYWDCRLVDGYSDILCVQCQRDEAESRSCPPAPTR